MLDHPEPGHEQETLAQIHFRPIFTNSMSPIWTSVQEASPEATPYRQELPLLFLAHAKVGSIWKNNRCIGKVRFAIRRFQVDVDPSDLNIVSGEEVLQELHESKGQRLLTPVMSDRLRWPVPVESFTSSRFVRLTATGIDGGPTPWGVVIPCTAVFRDTLFGSQRIADRILFNQFEGTNNRLYDPLRTKLDHVQRTMHMAIHADMRTRDEQPVAMLLSNPRGVPAMRLAYNSRLHRAQNRTFELRAHFPFSGRFEGSFRGIELPGEKERSLFVAFEIVNLKTEIFFDRLIVPREIYREDKTGGPKPPQSDANFELRPAPNIPPGTELKPTLFGPSLRNQRSAKIENRSFRSPYFCEPKFKKEGVYKTTKPRRKQKPKQPPKDITGEFSPNPRGTSDNGVPRGDAGTTHNVPPAITDLENNNSGEYGKRFAKLIRIIGERGYRFSCYFGYTDSSDPGSHSHFPLPRCNSPIRIVAHPNQPIRLRRIFVIRITNRSTTGSAYLFDIERVSDHEVSPWLALIRQETGLLDDEVMTNFLKDYLAQEGKLSGVKNVRVRKVLDQNDGSVDAWCKHHAKKIADALPQLIPDYWEKPDEIGGREEPPQSVA
jgi:hypothetical protein